MLNLEVGYLGDVSCAMKFEDQKKIIEGKKEEKAEFDEMIHKRVAAYPKFNYEYEMSVIRGTEV